MKDGSLSALHYHTGQPVRVSWTDGRIVAVEPAGAPVDGDSWIAPALVDLQINGFAGVDFQRDDVSATDLQAAVHALRAAGCSRFLLTLITDRWPRMLERLAHFRRVRQTSAELRHAICGWHLEGPFLSAAPGFCGAHDPALMVDPTAEHLSELHAITGSDPLLLTLAPERRGALEAISLAASLGIRVSLGHTNAPADVLRRAVRAGAIGFTHLGNACPQLLDRHDNILWRVLDTPGLTVSLIPDGHHVSRELFRLVHRALGDEPIFYVSDAMSAAGAPPGRYTLGSLSLEVGEDRIVRRPGENHFAGSALRPLEGVMRAAQMMGSSWRERWDAFSTRPARFLGLPSALTVGAPADLCLIRSPDGVGITELRLVLA